MRKGDYEAAVVLLEQAAVRRPEHPATHMNLALAYWKLGYHEDAARSARRAASLAPGETEPLELLAEVHAADREWEAVRNVLAEAHRIDPGSARVLTRMAVAETRIGEPGLARKYLDQALEINPHYGPALYDMARLHLKVTNDRATARRYFERYLDAPATDPDRRAAAKAFLSEAAPVAPVAPQAGVSEPAASAFAVATADAKAEPATERAAQIAKEPGTPRRAEAGRPSPGSPVSALVEAARQAVARQEYVAALIKLKEAVKADPADPVALWELAVLYDKHLGLEQKAREAYARYDDRFPGQQPGTARTEGIPPAEAPEVRALRIWGEGLEAHKRQDWDAAIRLYEQALSVDGACLNAAYNLGLVHKARGNAAAAAAAFRRALAIEPGMTKARYMLGVVLRDLKDYGEAESVASELVAHDPDYANGHLLMGLILRESGQEAKSLPSFRRFLELAPDDPSAPKVREWLQR